ncbi:MAG: ABC transporter substrate-binding protein [Clostridiales bacterium]|uniref:ABC transporter substrate-binding protein n=2 Tax=Zhenhengia yiwuensis TaxID=2763666 RepID=A0A926ELF9_9FIRM|nr:ABC transporter substrate-binding protein [Zhenhengia yiwuensis]MBS5800307.1 ABC transporter substrate-binding protein [Clostridiales bacterium]
MLGASLIAMISINTVGCASGQAAEAQSSVKDTQKGSNQEGEMIELEFWYSWQDKVAENNQELTEKFNETVGKENNIRITAEYQGSYDELHTKLKSAFIANEQPAISVMEIASIKSFADAGMIEPLENYISDEKESNFLPGLMDNSYVDGKLYGVPYLRSTPIFYYNKTLFDQAGITSAPTNWEELASTSKQLESIGVKGFGFLNDIWHFEAYTQGNGGNIVNADETEAIFNQEPAVEAVEFLKEGIEKYNFKYYSGNNASDTRTTEIMNQKIGMWVDSTGSLNNTLDIAGQNGYEIGTAFIPCGKEYSVPTGGCNIVMTSKLTDEEKEAAALFINFMTEEEQVVYSHKKTGYLPTTISSTTHPEIEALYESTPQFKVAVDQLQYGHGRPMNKAYGEAYNVYINALDQIFTTDVKVQDTLDKAAMEATKLLQESK